MSKSWIKMGTESNGAFSFKKQKRKTQRETGDFMKMERETGGDGGLHGVGGRHRRGQMGFTEKERDTGGTVPLANKCPEASEFRRGRESSLLTAFTSHDLPGD